jgi:DNA-binding response OmpR family regulator
MRDLTGSKILVVEDNPQMCESIRYLLCSHGYTVKASTDLYDALNSLLFTTFDLIVLDLYLDEQSGFVIMDYLLIKGLDTRVIIITGQSSEMNAITALKKGAYDYLEKPFEPDDLLYSVKNALLQRNFHR